jgi:glycosyltransferase involved in cell wall biosynthesis
MAHLVTVAAQPKSVENFRGDLIRAAVTGGHAVTAMSGPATPEEIQRIVALGADFRPYAVERAGLNPLRDLATFAALRSAFKALRPDVVLAAYIKPVIWSGLAVRSTPDTRFYALIEGLGLIFQPHGVVRRLLMRVAEWLYWASLRRASKVIFLNVENRDLFVSQGIVPASKCEIIPGIGVNLEHFSEVSLPEGPPRFLLMARLLAAKGLREYAAAARIVKQRHPEAVFQLLGPGDSSPDAISLDEVRSWHAEGAVHYLGEATDVRSALAGCQVFVLPTSYPEGMPRTLLEAMAMGRPVVTTDAPGCRETVEDGQNGFLVPLRDPAALADRLTWLIEHRDRWPQMGRRSRQIAEERFNVHDINARLLAIMDISPS